jgi:Homeodomain-like domain
LGSHAGLHHRTVDQELLLRNEYLAAENRILRAQIKGRMLLSEAEKATLAEIAHRLGRKALEELAAVAKPDTLLAWYRKLIASKFDGSKSRKSRGRPRVDEETERLVVRMAKENPGWGYDRIVGAMANLGLGLSDQTVGNILRRHRAGYRAVGIHRPVGERDVASGRAFQGQSNQQLRGSAGNTAHDWKLILQLTFCTAKGKRVMSG